MNLPRRRHASLRASLAAAVAVAIALLTMPALLGARMLTPAAGAAVEADDAGYTATDLEWIDAARDRRIPARLFRPASADRSVPVALIVFSPGIGSSRDGYTHLGRYWARHGIASLHLQHVGSDRSLWQGDPLGLLARLRAAAGPDEAVARAGDLRYALDRLLASRYGPRIARDAIVAAGHSYGANTTLLAIGAAVPGVEGAVSLKDRRIGAAILISAPPFYGAKDFAPILAGISIPTLHITTREDVIRIPGFVSGPDDRLKVFDATGGTFKALAVYAHGSHNVFTDRRYFDTAQIADPVKEATQTLSTAFVDRIRSGRNEALDEWAQAHRPLLERYVLDRHLVTSRAPARAVTAAAAAAADAVALH
ncbi:MAG TPA: hypothetical protein VMR06_13535 [Dokdonella sp.]|uniref:alpha/beta hydrolase family protein n=1 Tax=Dokdonella sp. TaxID=2291710 RepID=UPI002C26BA94|nr:hypothetical protein [Dokdonella sp.]HUD43007.1 hypothetical protein [Dokdonella sp.]